MAALLGVWNFLAIFFWDTSSFVEVLIFFNFLVNYRIL